MELKLVKLDIINRHASLGNDYYILNRDYPNWSNDLHQKGNILDNEILENIAINGIIHWYHTYHTMIDIDYNYYDMILHFINFPYSISFNDNIILNQLAVFADIEPIITINHKTKHYELLTINNDIFNKYAILPWGHYLIDMKGKDNVILFLQKLLSYIKKNYIWFEDSWLTSFIKKYPIIKKLGIVFQRFKIVLEKIKNMYHPDIYKLDLFIENIQTIIYSICIQYINNFKNMNTELINIKLDWIDNEYFYNPVVPSSTNFKILGDLKIIL